MRLRGDFVRHDCPNCDAPAGRACHTRGGKTAAKYHTPRFVLVPALREELEIPVPADRLPGRVWKQGPAVTRAPATRPTAGSARPIHTPGGTRLLLRLLQALPPGPTTVTDRSRVGGGPIRRRRGVTVAER
ncbi:hypothetical protein ACFU8Q_24900 [Streptomyces sp. NPDC057543]|uniref:zinc finger domain-containing protein n=1 Tax=Streptomyces sp. NPDC057543 TaxID=3346163 RepID=UPI003675E9BC